MVNKIVQALGNGLFPNYCCLCQWPCPGSLPLCQHCRAELVANPQCCRRCALPLATDAPLCGGCQQQPPAYDKVIAPWLYCEYLAHIIGRWKFNRDRALTPLLANLWHSGQLSSLPPIDVVAPVPLHWRRQWQRGYNQAELLGIELARIYPWLSVNAHLVRRQRATQPQAGMDARSRSGNLGGAFTANGSCDNLRVALVDDVLTTGATASEVASTLKQAGAARVEVWCLARTPAPENRDPQ
ncbi:MAG: ComF family protein [Halioglobus sp.]